MPDTITIDREVVERFIIEVDALARFESTRNRKQEGGLGLEQHIYEIIEQFERATLGRMCEEEAEAFHLRGVERGNELAREMYAFLFEEVSAGAS